MGLKIKTKIRLFLFFSLIFLFVIFAFSLLNEFDYFDDNGFDERYFEYLPQHSALATVGLQREMTIYIQNTINENGLYIYAAKDAQMKEFLELEQRDSLAYEMDSNFEDVKNNLNSILFDISFFQESNMLIGKETEVNNITNAVKDYLSKKENNYFASLSIKEIISYYKQLTNEIIDFNKQIKMLSKDNKINLFMDDYISLMEFNYNVGLMFGSGAYLSYYKKYDRDIYDDFISSAEAYDKYLDDLINMYDTYVNDYVISRSLNELKEEIYIEYFKKYVLEQYKDGNSPKQDEVFIFLHEYEQTRHKYFNALFDISDNSHYSLAYKNTKSSETKASNLISYIVSYLNFITLWALILYFFFILILNIILLFTGRNLKKVEKYLINTYYSNKDLSLDPHIILGDTVGIIGKTIIKINKLIESIMCIKEEKNNKSENL